MTEKELQKNLQSRQWRLNNLYWIKNEKGQRIKFKLNWAQNYLLDHLWFLNIILKARQLGITTFFCILYLDDVIFNGYDAGLIAHTLDDAKKIFDTKIKYAWDNMPEVLKSQYNVDKDTARELKFKRGEVVSSIYVGTSLRSQTVQRLHISELGTLDQKYPQKSIEIQSGALNTVHKGQIVTIESTAKAQCGIFYDMCQTAMDLEKANTNLSEMDYRFFFFPWYKHPAYKLEGDMVIPRELQEYFKKIELEMGIELTKEQKNWYYKKKSTQDEQMRTEFPSTPEEAFQLNIEGAYLGKQMDKVMEQNRICKVPFDPKLKVETWWDLGTDKKRSDSTAIIFTQTHGLEIRIIDYYGNHGEGIPHYARILKEKGDKLGYIYDRHHAPHDIEVKDFSTGTTRLETARGLGVYFHVLPRMNFLDTIEASRNILAKCWFDEEKTERLVKALKSFRKEWDDKLGKFKDTPLKDWSSDPADAFRMLAIGHKGSYLAKYTNKDEEEFRMEKDGWDPTNPFPDIG